MNDIRAGFHYFGADSGACVSYTNPQPEQIKTSDLALSLARQCRGVGHDSMTIAQHSLIATFCMFDVHGALSHEQKINALFHALLHDAAEAYTGDIPMPLKTTLRDMWAHSIKETFKESAPSVIDPFKIIEAKLDAAIWQSFELDAPDEQIRNLVKCCDGQTIALEMRDVMSPARRQTFLESGYRFQDPRDDICIKVLSETTSQRNFISAIALLGDQRKQPKQKQDIGKVKSRFRSLAGLEFR